MFCRCSHINDLMVTIEVFYQVFGRHDRDHRGIMVCGGGSGISEVSMRVETEFSS